MDNRHLDDPPSQAAASGLDLRRGSRRHATTPFEDSSRHNQTFANGRYRVIYRCGSSPLQRTESSLESRVAHSLSSAWHMMSGCCLSPSNRTSP